MILRSTKVKLCNRVRHTNYCGIGFDKLTYHTKWFKLPDLDQLLFMTPPLESPQGTIISPPSPRKFSVESLR